MPEKAYASSALSSSLILDAILVGGEYDNIVPVALTDEISVALPLSITSASARLSWRCMSFFLNKMSERMSTMTSRKMGAHCVDAVD